MRRLFTLGLVVALATLSGSTLRQLSLNDMILQSTSIVRGKVQLASPKYHGSMIFTHYTLQVTESYKGNASGQIDIGVPGGTLGGVTQRYAGSPSLNPNLDYVIFLWTSKTGLTQVIGLSQGLFSVIATQNSPQMVVRAASTERMLNAAGQQVADNDIEMPLSQLKTQIQTVLMQATQ